MVLRQCELLWTCGKACLGTIWWFNVQDSSCIIMVSDLNSNCPSNLLCYDRDELTSFFSKTNNKSNAQREKKIIPTIAVRLSIIVCQSKTMGEPVLTFQWTTGHLCYALIIDNITTEIILLQSLTFPRHYLRKDVESQRNAQVNIAAAITVAVVQ